MSHELRTPLNAILGRAELLSEQIYGPVTPQQVEALQSIDSSGHHLLALINDILDLSKIEAGKLTLQIGPVEIQSLCYASQQLVAQSALAKCLSISSTFDPQVRTLYADERRLKQILVNLLSNAVKFTAEGGKVGVEIRGDSERQIVAITVWDTGIGIAAEDLPRLFTPFTQVDSGLNREYDGTGLGLALVLRLAQAHGGTVDVESAPGVGSRFSVTLPWHSAPPAPPEPARRAPLAAPPRAPGQGPGPRPAVLVVDDNEAGSAPLIDYLQAHGYPVQVARSGDAAIAQARREPPAVVLMDIQLPGADGLEVTRLMRADERLRSVAIIALTALAMPGDRERCLAAGADAYLARPVSLRALLQMIAELLGTPPP